MDAVDDADIGLQRSVNDSIVELKYSLPRLLYKGPLTNPSDDTTDTRAIRREVRKGALDRLIEVLSTFQELPQLLDPHLEELLKPLSNGLVQWLPDHASQQAPSSGAKTVSTFSAICGLLYNFCKVRGSKVVVRFLSNAAKHLHPLVETLGVHLEPRTTRESGGHFSWEEKYVAFLWLSHLVLTPFPLSGAHKGQLVISDSARKLGLPEDLHVVSRICSLALSQLSSASKERDAAVTTLVHLTKRPDMIKIQLMDRLLNTIQLKLQERPSQTSVSSTASSIHETIGLFSLLAGIFNATEAHLLAPHISGFVQYVLHLTRGDTSNPDSPLSFAVTRKLVVKILRCSTVAALSLSTSSSTDSEYQSLVDELLEEVIEQLLEYLGDPDTPVRHAASKALSVITLKLEPEMAAEVTDAVIASLDEGILWPERQRPISNIGELSRERDLSLVNPLRWQGLMLTLAQLLFRKCPKPETLPAVISSLLLGLSFEQRTSTGVSVGAPVRDAANFGIWSLARQYSTTELSEISPSSIRSVGSAGRNISVLQILACELICSACHDPSGNIRRGSSAALQELIGRHPDTVKAGISVVQSVDYHAVALRSSALTKVAVAASDLDEAYRTTLLAAALGWRGVSATDAESRRWAALEIGKLAGLDQGLAVRTLQTLRQRIQYLPLREVETRHGLVLSAERIIMNATNSQSWHAAKEYREVISAEVQKLWELYNGPSQIEKKTLTNPTLRPHLASEAYFRLLACLCSLTGHELTIVEKPEPGTINQCIEYLEISTAIREEASILEVSAAAKAIFGSGILSAEESSQSAKRWLHKSDENLQAGTARQSAAICWLRIIGHVFPYLLAVHQAEAVKLITFATTPKVEVEVRVAALQAYESVFGGEHEKPAEQYLDAQVLAAIIRCLRDYSNDQRGDIGSLVRVAALSCASHIPSRWHESNQQDTWALLGLSCGLAVEKLDRVRSMAWPCTIALAEKIPDLSGSVMLKKDHDGLTNTAYFSSVLELATSNPDHLLTPMLAGFVTGAGSGSDSVLRSSREALERLLVFSKAGIELTILKGVMGVLASSLDNERLAPQALATIAYLFETGVMTQHKTLSIEVAESIRELFMLVQKSHFKSTSIPRLLASIDIYISLAPFAPVHKGVLKKFMALIVHPFPLVRRRAAEGLYCSTGMEMILEVEWSNPLAKLKDTVQKIRAAILET